MGVCDNWHERIKPNTDRSGVQSKVTASEAAASEVTLGCRIGDNSSFMALEVDETILVPVDMMRKRNIQLLQIVGDSLVGDHLLDGDLVIIEKRNTRSTENSWRLRRIIKDAIPMKKARRH